MKEEGEQHLHVGRLLLGGVIAPIHSMALSVKGCVTFNKQLISINTSSINKNKKLDLLLVNKSTLVVIHNIPITYPLNGAT